MPTSFYLIVANCNNKCHHVKLKETPHTHTHTEKVNQESIREGIKNLTDKQNNKWHQNQ